MVDAIDVAAPVVALVGLWLYLALGKRHYGPDADYWEVVRRSVLPQLNRVARRNGLGYAAYQLGSDEYIGTMAMDVESAEVELATWGFERAGLLSAFKYAPDGRPERGSWVYRVRPYAERQLHVHLFEAEGQNGTDVYAHEEGSAINPTTAVDHYLGVGYVPLGDLGVTVRQLLEDGPDAVLARASASRRSPSG